MKPLRERNQAAVGGAVLVALVLAVVTVLFSDNLPIIGGGSTTYSAFFAESGGLDAGDEVQVAGVRVGEVSRVELAGDQVRVNFTVSDVRLGNETKAAIEIKTLLGEKYLALSPAGDSRQSPREPIPRQRTTTPFDIMDATGQLTTTVGDIDTARLAQSFQVISETFENSPEHVRSALDGLSALSRTISTRDTELGTLLADTSKLSGTLADRNEEVKRLLADGNLILEEIQRRREAISALLKGTQTLAEQLRGLVADNQQQLNPALAQLDKVTALLRDNQDNLSRGLAALAPFVRISTNTTGNGRWFEGYLCGLLPPYLDLGVTTVNQDGCQPPIAGPPGGDPNSAGGNG
jgi:phospholipid/cholesterol/gamma-HCH transport system substrate-binding protein